jgi:hypothetical protein
MLEMVYQGGRPGPHETGLFCDNEGPVCDILHTRMLAPAPRDAVAWHCYAAPVASPDRPPVGSFRV